MLQERINENKVKITTTSGLEINLFANAQVEIDRKSYEELDQWANIKNTIEQLNSVGVLRNAEIKKAVLSADFHRGNGICIGTSFLSQGFVLPQGIGKDVACGMRLLATDITQDEFDSIPKGLLEKKLRYIFFQGGRDIALSSTQREAMLRYGVLGLLDSEHTDSGIWKYWDKNQQEQDSLHCHEQGSWPTEYVWNMDEYIKGSNSGYTHDGQICSIGGATSNHFVEIQRIDDILDSKHAYELGLKKNNITVMAHTGSVSLGSFVGSHFAEVALKGWPNNLARPENGFYPIPSDSKECASYLTAMRNCANFAVCNRLFLGLSVIRAFSEVLNRQVSAKLVYDLPHNLIWQKDCDCWLHRKGSCPAEKDFPLLIPGSMGDFSYVLKGNGYEDALESAAHGAGRVTSRQKARHSKIKELEKLRIVGKMDLTDPTLRSDILQELQIQILEESPSSYRNITPVIESITGAGIASATAKVWPLLTVKG